MTVTARVEKPPIRTLWVDSFIGIKLAKLEKGEALPAEEADLLMRLREVVVRQTLAGKLLCVESDQDNEYASERLGEEVAGAFARLTLGIQLDHGLAITDKQIFIGMDAFVARAGEIVVPWMTFFHRDPIEELAEVEEMGFFVRVGPAGSPVVERLRQSRHGQAEEFERWREANRAAGRTFEEQLQAELKADASVLAKTTLERMDRLGRGQPLTLYDTLAMSGEGLRQSHWDRIGGKPEGIHGVIEYYLSEYHAALPENRTTSILWADIVTGNERVKKGDPGDVDLLPHALAVSHFVLTDKAARRRILRRGLDAELSVSVFSMSELPDLIDILEALEEA